MKALKEKRISLRSLWRMGLVILSVFALAFVSCNNSATEDPSNTEAPTSGVVPLSMFVSKYPTSSTGKVYEGLPVDLSGIELTVTWSNGNQTKVYNPKDLKVYPTIYDWRLTGGSYEYYSDRIIPPAVVPRGWVPMNFAWYAANVRNSYTVSYCFGNRTISTEIPQDKMGRHLRIQRLHWTGAMNKQEYFIDEIPDFTGLTGFEGSYHDGEQSARYDETTSTYYHQPIPYNTDNPEYRWRWVWNDSGFVADDQGVFLAIGSYGDERSYVTVGGSTTHLDGQRIPVRVLHQIDEITYLVAPDYSRYPIFYDDPTLIGFDEWFKTGALDPEYSFIRNQFIKEKWENEIFAGTRFKVTYKGTDKFKEYDFIELLNHGTDQPYYHGPLGASGTYTANDSGIPGLWESLEWYLLDPTNNNKEVNPVTGQYRDGTTPDYTIGTDVVLDQVFVGPLTYNTTKRLDNFWEVWSRGKAPTIRFRFRGQKVDTLVPIYTKLISIEANPRVAGQDIVMNGASLVYNRPEQEAEFFSKLIISATYSMKDGTTAQRKDLVDDISRGICRMYDNNPAGLGAGFVTEDFLTKALSTNIMDLLNADNCATYLNKKKQFKTTITFTGMGPYSQQSKKTTVMIGMINYTNPAP